jgi:ABC-2 type transport system ATP-binding protein
MTTTAPDPGAVAAPTTQDRPTPTESAARPDGPTASDTATTAATPAAAPPPSAIPGSAGADVAISVQGLVKRYGERAVVDSLSLRVGRGEIVALLGPNGAGKTTTVEVLEGYRRPDAGVVRVLGLDPWRDAAALRPRVGLMLQSGGVYTYGRPRELIHLFASFYADPADPDDLLERVGLAGVATKPYRVLSGGERQRLSLALALVGRPELAILDEPTAGMDPAVRAQTRDLIGGLRRSGVTVLLTTHDLGDVEALADRVVIVSRGHVLAEGTPASLAAPADDPDLVVRFARPLSDADAADLGTSIPGATVDPAGIRARVPGGAGDPARTAAVANWAAGHGVAIASLGTETASLESRYLALVGNEAAAEPEAVPTIPSDRRSKRRR